MVRRNADQETAEQDIEEAQLLTVEEFARRLRWDTTTVRRHIKDGVIDAIRLPHRGQRQSYRIRQATLDAILNGGSNHE